MLWNKEKRTTVVLGATRTYFGRLKEVHGVNIIHRCVKLVSIKVLKGGKAKLQIQRLDNFPCNYDIKLI